MTDQSGDRDYIIHGSLTFLSVRQKAGRLKKEVCSAHFSPFFNCNLQPFLVFVCAAEVCSVVVQYISGWFSVGAPSQPL